MLDSQSTIDIPNGRFRLAICAPGEEYGGVERFVSTLATYLRDRTEIQPIVVLFHRGKHHDTLLEAGIKTILVSPKWKYDFRAVMDLAEIFRTQKIDLVHTHGYKATILASTAARLCGLRTIKTEHGLIEPRKKRNWQKYRMQGNLLLDKVATRFLVDRVVYVTRDLRASFLKTGTHDRSVVIHNGIPPISVSPRAATPDIDRTAFNVGIVGRLSEVKGHQFLFTALTGLKDLSDLRLNVFGDGPLKSQLEDYSRREGLSGAIRFLGFKENIYDYMNSLDLLVMPSLHEGLPYTLLEAMYLKIPIIASNVGGFKEILENDKDSFLVDPGDIEGLAQAIRYMHDNEDMRMRIADGAYEKVTGRLMIDHMANQYLKVFYSTIDDHTRARLGRESTARRKPVIGSRDHG